MTESAASAHSRPLLGRPRSIWWPSQQTLPTLNSNTGYIQFLSEIMIENFNAVTLSEVEQKHWENNNPFMIGSKSLVWRRGGVTVLPAPRRLFTSCWILLRPRILRPWRSSLVQSQWCLMLLSYLLMGTSPRLMSWDILTLAARYNTSFEQSNSTLFSQMLLFFFSLIMVSVF